MSLDYFRRPLLSGKNLPRQASAVVRGSLRRSNPTIGVTVPHFVGVEADMTLIVKFEDGVERTATLTGNGFQQILNDINASITTFGRAFDSDGCIAIQSLTAGGLGSVEIIGGSAADLIGFDAKDGVPLRSVGGELASASEGRNGSPFGTAFPPRTENLSSDSYRVAMGRLAGNSDILYSEVSRRHARVLNAGDITTGDQTSPYGGSANYGLLSLPGGLELYTGYGALSAASTKEDLAPFFLLIDKATGQPAPSRVVAVIKGVPAPSFIGGVLQPFGNATTSDGNGNVLGILNPRFSPAAGITAIKNGRVIRAAAGTFSKVRVGDWVEITGVDGTINKDPWDNRGLRWVVEEKLGTDNDAIAVRSMSKGELVLAGTDVKDAQPVLELNDQLAGNQVYGNVQVYAGTFIDDPLLVVSPPISDTVELWAAVPKGFRDLTAAEDAYGAAAFAKMLMADQGALPDAVLTLPSLTLSGTPGADDRTLAVGEMYVRWKGRPVRIDGGAVVVGPSRGGDVWVYLDKKSMLVTIATGGGGAATAYNNLPIAYFPAGSQNSVNSICRLQESAALSIMVGVGGHFTKLEEAIEWFHQASTAGVPQVEIVLLNNVTLPTGGVTVKKPGLCIRGAAGTVAIARNGGDTGYAFTLDQSVVTSFQLSNLTVDDLSKVWTVTGAGATPNVTQSNVRDLLSQAWIFRNNLNGEISYNATSMFLRGLNSRTLDLADNSALLLGQNSDAVYTTVRSRLKANRIAELVAGLFVGEAAGGTGNATFYGNVNIGQSGKLRTLQIIGNITVTGTVSLGSAGGTAVETLSKLVAKGGLDVGTTSVPADANVYGNLVVGQAGNLKSLTVNGTLSTSGKATLGGDVDVLNGLLKAKTLQVNGANGFNVDATGKVTVGGAAKGYLAIDGEVGNQAGKLDANGKLWAKSAQIGPDANGTVVDTSGNVQVGGANKARLGVDGSVKGNSFVAQNTSGVTQASISGTDGSASFKKAVVVNSETATANAEVMAVKKTVNGVADVTVASVDKEGDLSAATLLLDEWVFGKAAKSAFGSVKLAELLTLNPLMGPINPLIDWRNGRKLILDEEFSQPAVNSPASTNGQQSALGIVVYNNYSAQRSVTHTLVTDAAAPNATGKVLQIDCGAGAAGDTSPQYRGGFYPTPQPPGEYNAVYLQVFRAKVPAGLKLEKAQNTVTNGFTQWLTNNAGTGRWETYAILTVHGDSGTQGVGSGYIYLYDTAGTPGITAYTWYVASHTVYDLTNRNIGSPILDARDVNSDTTPSDYLKSERSIIKDKGDVGLGTDDGTQLVIKGVNPTGGTSRSQEMAFSDGASGEVYHRTGQRGGAWGAWRKFARFENDGSLLVPRAGTLADADNLAADMRNVRAFGLRKKFPLGGTVGHVSALSGVLVKWYTSTMGTRRLNYTFGLPELGYDGSLPNFYFRLDMTVEDAAYYVMATLNGVQYTRANMGGFVVTGPGRNINPPAGAENCLVARESGDSNSGTLHEILTLTAPWTPDKLWSINVQVTKFGDLGDTPTRYLQINDLYVASSTSNPNPYGGSGITTS